MTHEELTDCALCGRTSVGIISTPIDVEYRGKTYSVVGIEREQCADCGEEYLAPGQMDSILKEAAHMAREDLGLLLPDQIRRYRTDLGLTQANLEAILGVGPKTVVRWEKGTVFQSAIADRMMRLVFATRSEVLRELLQAGDDAISLMSLAAACSTSRTRVETLAATKTQDLSGVWHSRKLTAPKRGVQVDLRNAA